MATATLIRPGTGGDARTAGTRPSRWSLAVLLAGTFMVVLDFFIVNVALPSMQRDLHASDASLEWVVAGFALTSAVFLITSGRLGDQLGRRRVFAVGLGLFTLSSAVCGLAPSAARPGRRTARPGPRRRRCVMPHVLSIITVTYEGKARVRGAQAYGLTMGLAAVLGQLIGGLLCAPTSSGSAGAAAS